MGTELPKKLARVALRTSLLYALAGALWILLSDRLLEFVVSDPALVNRLQTYKGSAFVAATAVLLFVALRGQLRRWEREAVARRRAEEALRDSQTRLQVALEGGRMGTWGWDLLNNRAWWDEATAKLFGRLREEMDGAGPEGFAALIHPEDRARVETTLKQAISEGRDVYDEYRILRPDGAVLWIADRARLERDAEGRPWRITGACVDITERKQTEQAVQERLKLEAKLSRLAATVPGVIYEFRLQPDGSFSFPYASPGVEEVFGLRAEDLAKDAAAAFGRIHADDVKRVFESIREAGRAVMAWREEFRVRHPRKGEVWVEARSSPQRESDGSVLWHGFAQDITERKRAEEAHARLATAVEQAAEIVVITDPAGAILYVNPAFEKVTGYSSPEVLGGNPRVLKSGKHNTTFYESMWNTLRQGKVWIGRVTNRKKSGALYEEEMTISPVFDSARKITHYVAVKRDVTQEVALENQLRQAQKMEAIGQLAGGVAHDFNNILTIIHGHASLLLGGELEPQDRTDCAQQIVQAAERASGLTRQLLLFSRKQVMQPANVDLNEVVGGMTRMLKRILGEDIALQSSLASSLPPVLADTGMIEQVLLNLAVNARDAMPHGGQLTIATGIERLDERQASQNPAATAGRFVSLSVSDNGGGIPPEILPRIFEPFFTTKEPGKGTGLGLATVHGIVQQHHGWVNVESEMGKGSTFQICLPAVEGVPANRKTAASRPRLPGGKETILVAEDEASVRLLVGNVLQRCGYTVLTAASGKAALDLWTENEERVDLLLTDLVMPDGVSGRDLAQRLQAKKPRLKVIYTSGYTAEVGKGMHLQDGVNFLQKPYSSLKLAQTVRRCLDAGPGA